MATGFSVMDALNKNSKAGVDESPRVNIESSQVRDGGLHSSTLSSRDIKILRLRPAN